VTSYVAAGLEQSSVVEPVDVLEGGDLDLLDGPPGSTRLDELGLEQPNHGLGEGVVVGVADRPDRWVDPGFGEAFGLGDGRVSGSGVVVADQAG
jgi:hypothetical protein